MKRSKSFGKQYNRFMKDAYHNQADKTARERAPAKLNLGLRVGRRLESGYHQLFSLFCPLEFGDEIRLELSRDANSERGVIRSNAALSKSLEEHLKRLDPGLPERFIAELESPKNLAWIAADRMRSAFFPDGLGLDLFLEKRIPIEAGLGGGSSDAAAVIRALCLLLGLDKESSEVVSLARSIGSDVPALLSAQARAVSGTGESLLAFDSSARERIASVFGQYEVLLVKPPWGASTKAMYEGLRKARDEGQGSSETEEIVEESQQAIFRALGLSLARDGNYLTFVESPLTLSFREGNSGGLSSQTLSEANPILQDFEGNLESFRGDNSFTEMKSGEKSCGEKESVFEGDLGGLLFNDFEAVYFTKFPSMQDIRDYLKVFGARYVFLAGSGSTLVGLFPESETPREKFEQLEEKGFFLQWSRFRP